MIVSNLEEPYAILPCYFFSNGPVTWNILAFEKAFSGNPCLYMYIYIRFFHKSMHVVGSPILAVPGPSMSPLNTDP